MVSMLSLSYLLMSIFIIILTSLSLHSIISIYFDQNSKLEQNPQLQAKEENTKINSDSLANINNVSDNSINNSISDSSETSTCRNNIKSKSTLKRPMLQMNFLTLFQWSIYPLLK